MDEGVKTVYRMMLLDKPAGIDWHLESSGYKIEGNGRRFYLRFRHVHARDLSISRKLVVFDTELPLHQPIPTGAMRANPRVKKSR